MEHIVNVNHVTKTYGAKYALNDVTFFVDEGDVLAYLGPNGSGKTTTLKSILGLVEIQSGDIQVLGFDVQRQYTFLYGAVTSLFDENGLYERLTARENLSFYLGAFQRKGELASALHLMEELDIGDEIDHAVNTYSKGMKRKLALVRSLSAHPKVLFMDEPFDGIDIENRAKIIRVMKEHREKYGITMMLTSHVMADIEDLAFMLLSVITTNLLQFMTMEEVMKLNLGPDGTAIQLGSISMYMSVILVLFVGHTLVNRYIYDERKNKAVQVMLASGADKTAIWLAKMAVAILISTALLLTIGLNAVFASIYYHLDIRYTALSVALTFMAMPALCFGMLSLISVAYWYFKNMTVFGMIFPIVAYIGIWNLSLSLAGNLVPGYLVAVSLAIGIGLFIFSYFLVSRINKERIVSFEA